MDDTSVLPLAFEVSKGNGSVIAGSSPVTRTKHINLMICGWQIRTWCSGKAHNLRKLGSIPRPATNLGLISAFKRIFLVSIPKSTRYIEALIIREDARLSTVEGGFESRCLCQFNMFLW